MIRPGFPSTRKSLAVAAVSEVGPATVTTYDLLHSWSRLTLQQSSHLGILIVGSLRNIPMAGL